MLTGRSSLACACNTTDRLAAAASANMRFQSSSVLSSTVHVMSVRDLSDWRGGTTFVFFLM